MLPAMSEWDLEIETRCRSHWHPEERMCWCPVDKAWMSHVCGTQGSGDEIKQCLSTRPQIRGLCRAQLSVLSSFIIPNENPSRQLYRN